MFSERDLRTFLVHAPKPAKIVVHNDEGTSEIIPGTGKTWASIARTVVALEANFVEVFATDGTLARALRDDGNGGASSLALPPAPVNMDPESARLMHFANLLYRATEFSTTLAFEKMVDLFERMNERSIAIEQRLERTETAYRRTLNDQLREAFEAAAADDDVPAENPLVAMARTFLEGSDLGKHAARAVARPPNGANGANGGGDGKGHPV